MLISVAIPVYRNKGSLPELHERIVKTVEGIEGADYEIIFVNDGSDDGSWATLIEIADKDSKVTVIDLSRNFGQHAANNAAFQHVKGDVVINMSADLQDPPEVIGDIVARMNEGFDIVLAAREKVQENWLKRVTSWTHYKLIRISVPNYPDKGFDFWGANKKAFAAFMSFNDIVRRNQTDLLSIGYKVGVTGYEKQKRTHGKSQYNFIKRLDISISQILATAIWPLRIAAIFGLLFTILGIVIVLAVLARWLFLDVPASGWTSIVSLLLLTSGCVMAILGVVGEYMWRIYYETKRRPLYFVDKVYSQGKSDE